MTDTSAAAAPPWRHIPSLDGIRALSFLLVFASHVGISALMPGDLGVTIFFFLSGFLITTLMRAEFAMTSSVDLRRFWLRRALRILPPFYLVLAAAMLLTLMLYPPGTMDRSTMLAELLFYGNYHTIYATHWAGAPGTQVVWSLAVEEHFYLLFPWLYVGMQKMRLTRQRQAWALWALCALVLVWRIVLVLSMRAGSAEIDITNRIYPATDTRIDSILFGCALGVWRNPVLDEPLRREHQWKLCILPAAVVVLLAATALREFLFRNTCGYSIQGVALTFIFIAAIRFPRWPIFRILNWRPVAFLGVLSYSLYLLHAVLLRAVAQLWPYWHGWQRVTAALAASIAVAWAIYLAVEKPCARLRKKLEW
jgi:peptidoglycan/LPS O-acetylase OafA/YrhL